MSFIKGLEKLFTRREEFDKESQAIISNLSFVDKELSAIEDMKRTEGWKVLDKKIRTELQARILEKVKDDLKIQTLLQILITADTKSISKNLEDEIEGLLPQ